MGFGNKNIDKEGMSKMLGELKLRNIKIARLENLHVRNFLISGRELTEEERIRVACYKIGEMEMKIKETETCDLNKYCSGVGNLTGLKMDMIDYVFPDSVVGDSELTEIAEELIKYTSSF